METALARSNAEPGELDKKLNDLRNMLLGFDRRLNGSRARALPGEIDIPTIRERFQHAVTGNVRSTYGPTAGHQQSLEIAEEELEALQEEMIEARDLMAELEEEMIGMGAPGIE